MPHAERPISLDEAEAFAANVRSKAGLGFEHLVYEQPYVQFREVLEGATHKLAEDFTSPKAQAAQPNEALFIERFLPSPTESSTVTCLITGAFAVLHATSALTDNIHGVPERHIVHRLFGVDLQPPEFMSAFVKFEERVSAGRGRLRMPSLQGKYHRNHPPLTNKHLQTATQLLNICNVSNILP